MTSLQEQINADLLHEWFEQVWNQKDETAIHRLMAVDGEAHGLDDGPVDREGFKLGWKSFLETFPDVTVTVDEVIAEGDKTAARLTVKGTHLGVGLGVPASGKLLTIDAHTMCRWKDSQIVVGWNVLDMVSAYRQIAS